MNNNQAGVQMPKIKLPSKSGIDDLKAFQIIADEYANGLRKLIPAFAALYASMTPAQQKHADQVFLKHERQSDF
jgi:hypothetical protein